MTLEQRLENIESMLNQLIVMVSIPKSAEDPDYISPVQEAQIRALARQNMAAKAAAKAAKEQKRRAA